MLSINRNIFSIYTLLEGPHFLSGPGLLLALHGPADYARQIYYRFQSQNEVSWCYLVTLKQN